MPIILESNQNHATITDGEVCPCLPAAMGLGGGYVPMIVDRGGVLDSRRKDGTNLYPLRSGQHSRRKRL